MIALQAAATAARAIAMRRRFRVVRPARASSRHSGSTRREDAEKSAVSKSFDPFSKGLVILLRLAVDRLTTKRACPNLETFRDILRVSTSFCG